MSDTPKTIYKVLGYRPEVIKCPHCQQPSAVPALHGKLDLECPYCKKSFQLLVEVVISQLPLTPEQVVADAQTACKAEANYHCDDCGFDGQVFSLGNELPDEFLVYCGKCAKLVQVTTEKGKTNKC